MTTAKRIIGLLGICATLACGGSEPRVPNIQQPEPDPPKARISLSFDNLSRLRADGKKVVNTQNQEVVLRAVGLGYWLLQEGYMLNPHDQSKAANQWQMKRIYYNEGLSEADVEHFYAEWRDNFITRKDVDYIASLGFNSVRLPMHYDLFLTKEQRAVRHEVIRGQITLLDYTNTLATWYDAGNLFERDDLDGFTIIDQLLEWCEANNLYVVLDLHAAPGGQGTDVNIADVFEPNQFWLGQDGQGRSIYQDITVKLWEHISKRYIDDDRIAWYDLINEPNNVPRNQWIRDIHDRIVNAIRANGDTHLIMIEGNGWGNNYNGLLPGDFTNSQNLIYSAHRYWISEADDRQADPDPNQINRILNLVNFRDRVNVPVWVGETGENTNDWLRQNIRKLENADIGWCHWPLKRHDTNPNAALMRIHGNFPTDGATAMDVVLESIKFENCIVNTGAVAAAAPIHY
ncbi:glycoside hydrolase family 5 protein [Parapedobacter soli]|uniref:glycoside hydrolase family 5 protein n=1 Tax=Parapedobacter soli TaxID=416955 RepID=UPI0021C6C036|nr:glycoside hydrolase family 5 protein [Parapedobacter soli]